MIRRLYSWTIHFAEHPRAMWVLAMIAFVESSIFPIPPDVLIIPMIIATPAKAFRIAAVATFFSVVGGLFGYAIGVFLFRQVGLPILEFYGKVGNFVHFQEQYDQWGAWAVLIAGLTPFPYKVVTILSGSVGLDLFIFTFASVLARGLRFYILALLLWRYGTAIRVFIERWLGALFFVFVLLLLGGFVAIRYIM